MVSLHRSMVILHSAMASLHGAIVSSIASFYDDMVKIQLAIVILCDVIEFFLSDLWLQTSTKSINKSTEDHSKILKKHILEKWICPSPWSHSDDPK